MAKAVNPLGDALDKLFGDQEFRLPELDLVLDLYFAQTREPADGTLDKGGVFEAFRDDESNLCSPSSEESICPDSGAVER